VVINCTTGCNVRKQQIKCDIQHEVFDKISNHFQNEIKTNKSVPIQIGSLPLHSVKERFFTNECAIKYNKSKMSNLDSASFPNRVIHINVVDQTDLLIHLNIEHRIGAKGVFYKTIYDRKSHNLDSIYFESLIVE